MIIVILASGSRGDVQPYVALGRGLKDAGHIVRLVTHVNFESLVQSAGLEFWPVEGDVAQVAQSPEMRALLEKGNTLSIMSQMAKEAQRGAVYLAQGGLEAAAGADLFVGGLGGIYIGVALAEKFGIPMVQAYMVPFTATRAFASVLLPGSLPKLGGTANRVSHHLTRQMMWQAFRSADRIARREVLDLPPAPFLGPYRSEFLNQGPILYGFSPSVIPPPADWDEKNHVTGYWFLDAGKYWAPPEPLEEFMDSGPPPVSIGFGSMADRNPDAMVRLVMRAIEETDQRAVLLSGWSGIEKADFPDSVYLAESVPHSWLFPRTAAVVHHGGAGTTAAGLRAGVPSILVPFFGDQPFWGQRVAELGVGPPPIPRKRLTPENLAGAIRIAVTDQVMRRRAAELGSKIQGEDGIAQAVDVIDRF